MRSECLRIARQIVDLEDDGRVLLEYSDSMRRGSLRIGAVSPFHVTEMIDKYHAKHPNLTTGSFRSRSKAAGRDAHPGVLPERASANSVRGFVL